MIILETTITDTIERKIRLHHELYPKIPVRAEYWESIASDSLDVKDWVVNNHNPNADFKTKYVGLLEPSLKSGVVKDNILNFSSHRMSKFSELSEMTNFLDTRSYDSYLFLSRKENESHLHHYLVGYMCSKKWKYSELNWEPIIGIKARSKGKQIGWKGEGLDGKLNVKIMFSMSNQLWIDVDMSLITIVKEIFI